MTRVRKLRDFSVGQVVVVPNWDESRSRWRIKAITELGWVMLEMVDGDGKPVHEQGNPVIYDDVPFTELAMCADGWMVD